jgi:hypothetical protein
MARRTPQNDGGTAVSIPDPARPVRRRAAKPATPKPSARKKAKPAKAAPSKAERVRALLDQGKTVLEVSKALDDVSWAYAWDIAAAWEKKTGKTVIPSHAKAGAQ